jgi:hypothetical protein
VWSVAQSDRASPLSSKHVVHQRTSADWGHVNGGELHGNPPIKFDG